MLVVLCFCSFSLYLCFLDDIVVGACYIVMVLGRPVCSRVRERGCILPDAVHAVLFYSPHNSMASRHFWSFCLGVFHTRPDLVVWV